MRRWQGNTIWPVPRRIVSLRARRRVDPIYFVPRVVCRRRQQGHHQQVQSSRPSFLPGVPLFCKANHTVFAGHSRRGRWASSILVAEPLLTRNQGEVPDLSLKDCTALEHVFLSVKGPTASFPIISSLISSISSNDFKSFTLKLQTTARRERDIVQTDLTDRISSLDTPLSRLGRLVAARNKKVSVVLLGQEPEFLAQGLIDFHEVGHIWAGEDMDEGRYLWSFTSPKRGATKRNPIRMFALFKRND